MIIEMQDETAPTDLDHREVDPGMKVMSMRDRMLLG